MYLPLTKPIEIGELTRAMKARVARVSGLSKTDGGTRLLINSLNEEFTLLEQETLRLELKAHDASAIQQTKQLAETQTRKAIDELEDDLKAWGTMTPVQQLAVCQKMLRIMLFQLKGR